MAVLLALGACSCTRPATRDEGPGGTRRPSGSKTHGRSLFGDAGTNAERGKMPFMSSREAWSMATELIGGWTEMAVSYCMPAIAEGRLRFVAFRYCLHPDPKLGSYFDAPVKVVLLDPVTGEPVEEDEAMHRLARIEHLPAVGWVRFSMSRATYAVKERELQDAVDAVLPAFSAGQTAPPPDVRAAAQRVDRTLEELKPGMRPYYAGATPEFFAWIARVTQGG